MGTHTNKSQLSTAGDHLIVLCDEIVLNLFLNTAAKGATYFGAQHSLGVPEWGWNT